MTPPLSGGPPSKPEFPYPPLANVPKDSRPNLKRGSQGWDAQAELRNQVIVKSRQRQEEESTKVELGRRAARLNEAVEPNGDRLSREEEAEGATRAGSRTLTAPPSGGEAEGSEGSGGAAWAGSTQPFLKSRYAPFAGGHKGGGDGDNEHTETSGTATAADKGSGKEALAAMTTMWPGGGVVPAAGALALATTTTTTMKPIKAITAKQEQLLRHAADLGEAMKLSEAAYVAAVAEAKAKGYGATKKAKKEAPKDLVAMDGKRHEETSKFHEALADARREGVVPEAIDDAIAAERTMADAVASIRAGVPPDTASNNALDGAARLDKEVAEADHAAGKRAKEEGDLAMDATHEEEMSKLEEKSRAAAVDAEGLAALTTAPAGSEGGGPVHVDAAQAKEAAKAFEALERQLTRHKSVERQVATPQSAASIAGSGVPGVSPTTDRNQGIKHLAAHLEKQDARLRAAQQTEAAEGKEERTKRADKSRSSSSSSSSSSSASSSSSSSASSSAASSASSSQPPPPPTVLLEVGSTVAGGAADAGATDAAAEDASVAADKAALAMMQYTMRGRGDHAKVRVKKYVSRAKRQNLQRAWIHRHVQRKIDKRAKMEHMRFLAVGGKPGGGCSAQRTKEACDLETKMWNDKGGKGSTHCAWCVPPPKNFWMGVKNLFGFGAKYISRCISCDNVELLMHAKDIKNPKARFSCTPAADECKAGPKPHAPGAEEKVRPAKRPLLEPADDNQMAEEMTKYISSAVITQSLNKLHQAMLHSLRQDINATVVRATGRTITQTLTISLTQSLVATLTSLLSKTLTRISTKEITGALTPTLTYSLTNILSSALTHNPHTDWFCYYCRHYKVYCEYCHAASTQDSMKDYYNNYFARHYSNYYTYYYAGIYADGFADDFFMGVVTHQEDKTKATNQERILGKKTRGWATKAGKQSKWPANDHYGAGNSPAEFLQSAERERAGGRGQGAGDGESEGERETERGGEREREREGGVRRRQQQQQRWRRQQQQQSTWPSRDHYGAGGNSPGEFLQEQERVWSGRVDGMRHETNPGSGSESGGG